MCQFITILLISAGIVLSDVGINYAYSKWAWQLVWGRLVDDVDTQNRSSVS